MFNNVKFTCIKKHPSPLMSAVIGSTVGIISSCSIILLSLVMLKSAMVSILSEFLNEI